MENYKLAKLWKNLKPYIKLDKIIIKLDDRIDEYEFRQHESSISINDINEIVVPN